MYVLYDVDAEFEIMKAKFKTEIYVKNSRTALYVEIFLIGYAM